MKFLLDLYLKKFFRENYPRWWSLLSQAFSWVLLLSTYWYTSQAFQGAFKGQSAGENYFSYVVWGEVLLILPLSFSTGLVRILQESVVDGTFDFYLLTAKQPETPLLFQALAYSFREFLQALVMLTGTIALFKMPVSITGTLLAFLVQFASLPIFVGLGFLISGFLLIFGRGTSLINQMTGFIAILSGAIFPLSVFPENLQRLFLYSPFAFLLQSNREFLVSGHSSNISLFFGQYLIWTTGSLALGIPFFRWGIAVSRKRGGAFINS